MENIYTTYEKFKEEVVRNKTYTVDSFWKAWHEFTGNTSHPFEVFELATDDDIIGNEKQQRAKNERVYQHRLAGRPTRRF